MKIRALLFVAVLVLAFAGIAAAGVMTPREPFTVPAFTPWGAILGAAVLGISGFYALLRKK